MSFKHQQNYEKALAEFQKSNPFYDPSDKFSQLDLSAFPSLQPPVTDEEASFHDDRFSQRENRASNFRDFINSPLSDDVAAELAKTNPDVAEEYNDKMSEQVANVFIRQTSDYYRCPQNYRAICETLAESMDLPYETEAEELLQMGVWTEENLKVAWDELKANGQAILAPNAVRRLSDSQSQWLASVCLNGDPHSAILQFIALSLGYPSNHVFSDYQQRQIIANPKLKPLFEDAVYFVFSNITLDFHPSEEFDDYLTRYVAGRLPTVPLYQSAWQGFKKDNYSVLLGSPKTISRQDGRSLDITDIAHDLDSLSDEEILQTKRAVLREMVKQQKSKKHE